MLSTTTLENGQEKIEPKTDKGSDILDKWLIDHSGNYVVLKPLKKDVDVLLEQGVLMSSEQQLRETHRVSVAKNSGTINYNIESLLGKLIAATEDRLPAKVIKRDCLELHQAEYYGFINADEMGKITKKFQEDLEEARKKIAESKQKPLEEIKVEEYLSEIEAILKTKVYEVKLINGETYKVTVELEQPNQKDILLLIQGIPGFQTYSTGFGVSNGEATYSERLRILAEKYNRPEESIETTEECIEVVLDMLAKEPIDKQLAEVWNTYRLLFARGDYNAVASDFNKKRSYVIQSKNLKQNLEAWKKSDSKVYLLLGNTTHAYSEIHDDQNVKARIGGKGNKKNEAGILLFPFENNGHFIKFDLLQKEKSAILIAPRGTLDKLDLAEDVNVIAYEDLKEDQIVDLNFGHKEGRSNSTREILRKYATNGVDEIDFSPNNLSREEPVTEDKTVEKNDEQHSNHVAVRAAIENRPLNVSKVRNHIPKLTTNRKMNGKPNAVKPSRLRQQMRHNMAEVRLFNQLTDDDKLKVNNPKPYSQEHDASEEQDNDTQAEYGTIRLHKDKDHEQEEARVKKTTILSHEEQEAARQKATMQLMDRMGEQNGPSVTSIASPVQEISRQIEAHEHQLSDLGQQIQTRELQINEVGRLIEGNETRLQQEKQSDEQNLKKDKEEQDKKKQQEERERAILDARPAELKTDNYNLVIKDLLNEIDELAIDPENKTNPNHKDFVAALYHLAKDLGDDLLKQRAKIDLKNKNRVILYPDYSSLDRSTAGKIKTHTIDMLIDLASDDELQKTHLIN